jgi:hypothetical protein
MVRCIYLAGPFGMVQCSVWPPQMRLYSICISQSNLDGMKLCPASPFGMIQSYVQLVYLGLFHKMPCLASPFGMVQFLVWPIYMKWYKVLSSWSIWNVTMFCSTGSFEITQDMNWLVDLG